ncbi:hypothetical protein [Streptomyces sp. SDr-06]|uniref:hypothetical protein n=1 Tax=Streptomyces sp. SDr-06 TaxID=2267702 RepID=UPI0011C0481B|nr:hypothetical protein [Streptomyces sp. SDr-06]
MTETSGEAPRACFYCPQPGADCCIRLAAITSGPPRPVFAHAACAADHGIKPLYHVTDEPSVVMAFPWA